LLSRAGFGGTPAEVEKLVKLGPAAAVAQFVDYEDIPDDTPNPEWAKADPNRMEKFQAVRKLQQQLRLAKNQADRQALEEKRRQLQKEYNREQLMHGLELRDSWLKRMAFGPRPLQEKLTLFWHGHFATSAQKVKDAYFMWLQNDIFRRHASGNWLKMLVAVGKDPAMLIWLDQAQSRKEHPNENFARELMELFALGEGHYTEKDVTEAARALTGWTLNRLRQTFEYRSNMHDGDIKTILGHTGNFTGDDVIRIVVDQPQAARFITAKLWSFFAAENPSSELVEALASVFRKGGSNFKPLLRTMFLSEEFYDDSVIGTQVKSPVQWLVGTVRMLASELPPAVVSSQILRALGQELLLPPNVKGWDGGVSWITTNSLLSRYNAAAFLVFGEFTALAQNDKRRFRMMEERARQRARGLKPVDVAKVLSPDERGEKKKLLPSLERNFLQVSLKPKQRQTLLDYIDSRGELDDDDIRHAIRLLMSTPEYQLT
jgi:uncharacterized protein (DUF1800 family)